MWRDSYDTRGASARAPSPSSCGGAWPRNADPNAPSTGLDERFRGIMSAYDQCIAKVEGNIPWYEWIGGPLLVGADVFLRWKETEAVRNDRKNLLARWKAATTDSERSEILKLAERWFAAARFALGDCNGILP